jgi:hypothetical protein
MFLTVYYSMKAWSEQLDPAKQTGVSQLFKHKTPLIQGSGLFL